MVTAYVVGILLSFLLFIEASYLQDRKNWNNGICPWTGEPWEYRGKDESGKRYYTTKSGRNIHLYWGVDT